MTSQSTQKILASALILAIGVLSFVYYSALYFKGYNSDQGIHLLMAEGLELPRDLYYRGQDRLGSILPILGHLFVILGATPLLATSIAQYLLLAGCFFFLRPFFTHPWQRVLLAATLFLPNWAFLEQVLVGHPYIGHFFFTSAFLFLYFHPGSLKATTRYFLLGITALLALWSSELALVNFAVFAAVYRKELLTAFRKRSTLLAALTGILLGSLFVLTAKVYGTHTANFYHFFANGDQMLEAVKRLTHSIYEQAIFEGNKPPARYLFWVVILLGVVLMVKPRRIQKLPLYFLLSAAGSMLLVIASYWPTLNDYALRYYTPAFLQLLLFLILTSFRTKAQIALLTAAISLSCYTGIYVLNHFSLEVDDRLNREEMEHFAKLGNMGIIGSYWNTHAVDALSPQIVATPYDGHYNRMYEKIPEVLQQDTIVLIRNGFLDALPDSIVQFNRNLVRIGPIEHLNEFEYAYYR
jgi:hypothetical protein